MSDLSDAFPNETTAIIGINEPDAGLPWMEIAYYVCEVILATCAAIGNATIIGVVVATKKLHTVPNTYLVSMAVSDLCMGVVGIPILLLALNGWPPIYPLCLSLLTIVLLLDLCSMYSLMAHTFNQYYATCRPLHYPTIATTTRVVLHLVLAWLVPLAIALVMPIGWNTGNPTMHQCLLINIVSMDFLAFMFFVGMIPPFIAMCLMYRSIFKAISKQMHQIEDLEKIKTRLQGKPCHQNDKAASKTQADDPRQHYGHNGENLTDDDSSTGATLKAHGGQPMGGLATHHVDTETARQTAVPHAFKRVQAERKKALFFCFLMLFLFFTWCPIFTLDSLVAFGIFPTINQHVFNLAVLLSHFNSAFNPVIYSRKSEFKRALARLWARITCRNRRVHVQDMRLNSVPTISGSQS